MKSLDRETSCALQLGDVCGHFIASSNAIHRDALLRVTVLHEPSHWLTAHSQQDLSEINLLCAGQREGKVGLFGLFVILGELGQPGSSPV